MSDRAPASDRAARPGVVLAAAAVVPVALLLGPAALERAGAAPHDEALRLPLVLGALAAALVVAARRGAAPPRRALVLAGLFAAPAVLALASSLVRGVPVARPTFLSLGWLGPHAATVAGAAALVVGAGATPAGRRTATVGLAIAGVLAAAWVIVDRLGGRPAVGPFGRSGVAGPTLAVLAFAVQGALTGSRVGSVPAAFAQVLVLAGVLATGSRTGVAAAVAGALAVACVRGAGGLRRGAITALGVGALGVAALAAGVRPPAVGGVASLDPATVDVRRGLLRTSAALVAARPLLGHGLFGFPAGALPFRDLEEARISSGGRPLAAHNDVAHAAVEGGLGSGLALLLGFAGAVAVTARAARRGARDGAAGTAAFGAACALAVASLAENPLLSAAAAPAALLLVGGACGPARASRPSTSHPWTPWWLLAVAGVATATALDHGVALAQTGSRDALASGSFLATERLRARAYDAAAARAREGRFREAREAYDALLAWDPGATEARLDVAETYRREGRRGDAMATLATARRFDPTRFDVPQRLGHLHLGDEPTPGATAPEGAPAYVEALRAYNEAAALQPGRFETPLAHARVHRRRGDLARADAALEDAARAAAARGQGTPAELLLEVFRLSEAVGAPLSDRVAALALALRAGPGATGDVLAEADAALGTATPSATAADAAAVRFTGALRAGQVAPEAVRAAARAAAAAGDGARAVARYRALLADPYATPHPDLALEARAAAVGVDPARAEAWAGLARTLLGFEALARGDAAAATREFRAALARDGTDVLAWLGLARAAAATGDPEEAARARARAAELDPKVPR